MGHSGNPSAGGFSPVVSPPENLLTLNDVGIVSMGRSGNPSAVVPIFSGDPGVYQETVKPPEKSCSKPTAPEKVVLAVDSGGWQIRKPFSGGPLSVVGSVGPSFVDLMSEEVSGDPRDVLAPARVCLEWVQSESKSRVDERAVLSQVTSDLHLAEIEVSNRLSWQLGSCSGSVGGGIPVWQRSAAGYSGFSGLSGLGLQMNYLPHLQPLQDRDIAGNSNRQPSGCSEVVVFQEGDRPSEVAGSGEEVCGLEEMKGDAGRVSPLNSYSTNSGVFSCYSNWVIQCANAIYPIVGVSYEGHKLQFLALLTHIEAERRNGAVGVMSGCGTKGKREVNNLKCSINYDARGSCSSHGSRKMRGHQVLS
jgi:hypothetical protein